MILHTQDQQKAAGGHGYLLLFAVSPGWNLCFSCATIIISLTGIV